MSTISINVDDALKERMERHPELNWSEVTRRAIPEKVTQLRLMDELTSDNQLTNEDVEALADKINEDARMHVEDELE